MGSLANMAYRDRQKQITDTYLVGINQTETNHTLTTIIWK